MRERYQTCRTSKSWRIFWAILNDLSQESINASVLSFKEMLTVMNLSIRWKLWTLYWGPILFIIEKYHWLINDISDFFTGASVTVKLYAYDEKLYSFVQCADDMHSLQLGLDFVHKWSLAWQLSLSVTKCPVLQLGRALGTGSYTVNNINLPMNHKTRDFGILIDS